MPKNLGRPIAMLLLQVQPDHQPNVASALTDHLLIPFPLLITLMPRLALAWPATENDLSGTLLQWSSLEPISCR